MQPRHGGAGGAEHHGQLWIFQPQRVDHRALDVMRRHDGRLVGDVAMRLTGGGDLDPQCVALVALRQLRDRAGHCGREQQRAPLSRHGVEDRLQLVAETQVEHLVCLVQDDDLQALGVEVAALDVIAQPARRADHHVHALVQRAPFHQRIHATDAAGDAAAGLGVKPHQLGLYLQRKFTGRRDDQRERRAGLRQAVGVGHQVVRHGHAVGDRLARAGFGGDQQIAIGTGFEHGGLDRRGCGVLARGEGGLKGRGEGREGHVAKGNLGIQGGVSSRGARHASHIPPMAALSSTALTAGMMRSS